MPCILRYSATARGAVTITGNTLGLCSGVEDDIGVFTTVDTSLQVPGFPAGTTLNFNENSSAALLNLPVGSTVLYAELIWGGSFTNGTQDVSAFLNDPISLTLPGGTTTSVLPDPATAADIDPFYVRSANITSLVAAAGAGFYTVGTVPGTTHVPLTSNNCAGWTMEVVFGDAGSEFHNMAVYVCGDIIFNGGAPVDIAITGFSTPDSGPLVGRADLSAMDGDPEVGGDQFMFGPDAVTLTPIDGPNNPIDNFFCSQINDDLGELNTTGTFGLANATPGGPLVQGVRQGWDITNVDISSTLLNNQTNAIARITTTGDTYALDSFSIQIAVPSPAISAVKSAAATDAFVNETIAYEIAVTNNGLLASLTTVLTDPVPAGAALVPGTVTADGITIVNPDLSAGIPLGPLAPGQTIIIQYELLIVAMPPSGQLINQAEVLYTFQPESGPLIEETALSEPVAIIILAPRLTVTKSSSASSASIQDVVAYQLIAVATGNALLTGLQLSDPLPAGTSLIASSVRLNGQPVQQTGDTVLLLPLGSLAPGQSSILTYALRIESVPAAGIYSNQAVIQYIAAAPSGRTQPGSDISNTVTITAAANPPIPPAPPAPPSPVPFPPIPVIPDIPVMRLMLEADRTTIPAGATAQVTARTANSGTIAVDDIVLSIAVLPAAFIPGTLRVNGAISAVQSLDAVPLGTRLPGQSDTVQLGIQAGDADLFITALLTSTAPSIERSIIIAVEEHEE